jgi:predicted nucleic acid-binding protein
LKKFAKLPDKVSFTDCLLMAAADEYYTPDIFGFDKQFGVPGATAGKCTVRLPEAVSLPPLGI